MISLLVAYDDNRLMGNQGKLPWHNPEDLKFFKNRTLGRAIIMGMKTWESLPKRPLPNRLNIILSRTHPKQYNSHPPIYFTYDIHDAIKMAKSVHEDVYIIGGLQIYKTALAENVVDRIVVSHIPGTHEGDLYFPELDAKWICVNNHQWDTFSILEYEQRLGYLELG
jgi:dihydrofolate reductase